MERRPNTILAALAWAARTSRRRAGVRRHEIAIAADVDPSTVERFERARAWPRDPARLIEVYAAAADVQPREIWVAAVNAWDDTGA